MADNLSLLGGRMPTQQQGPKLSTVLQGLQAAYTGQGPQFLQQVQQQEQYDRQKAMQDFQMQETLAKSAAQDAVRIRGLLDAGNVNQAIELLRDRAQLENRIGASSDATQNLMQMLMNDPMSAIPSLDSAIASAYQIGLIQMPKQDELTISQLREVGTSARKLNQNVDEITTAYNKVKGLEKEMRAGSRSAINAGIMNVARLISPGVVTDADARQIAGADTPYNVLLDVLAGRGIDTRQLLAIYDPTNPEVFNVDQLMNVANSVTAAGIPSIYDAYSDLQNTATDFGANARFMSAYFNPESKRMQTLGRIRDEVSANPMLQESVTFPDLQAAQSAYNAGEVTRDQVNRGLVSYTEPDGTVVRVKIK